MVIRRVFLLVVHIATLLSPSIAFSAVAPVAEGAIEVRVCQDRDCLTDGALEANAIIKSLVKSTSSKMPVTVTKCGCLGPCGKGPNVDIKIDGIRVKDNRVGQNNFYCFRNVDSANTAAIMLEKAGIVVTDQAVAKVSDATSPVESSREFWDFDRTTRIALQRLLYITVALPIIDADHNGTMDIINGQVYPNSYAAIAAITFIGSQFMGTKAASVKPLP